MEAVLKVCLNLLWILASVEGSDSLEPRVLENRSLSKIYPNLERSLVFSLFLHSTVGGTHCRVAGRSILVLVHATLYCPNAQSVETQKNTEASKRLKLVA